MIKIPLVQDPPLEADEIEAAIAVLRSGRVTQGEKVAEFERVFSEAHGYPADRAVFCNSGSSANLLAVTALGLQPGEEVIVPAVTWPTQVWPIVQVGAVPVLVDVDPETVIMHLPEHEGYSKSVTAHLLGQPGYLPGENSLDDCCEALGAEIRITTRGMAIGYRKVGTYSRFATFSFYLSHHITTIEGGMVLCRDAQDADKVRMLRAHGWARDLSPEGRQRAQEANPGIDP